MLSFFINYFTARAWEFELKQLTVVIIKLHGEQLALMFIRNEGNLDVRWKMLLDSLNFNFKVLSFYSISNTGVKLSGINIIDNAVTTFTYYLYNLDINRIC